MPKTMTRSALLAALAVSAPLSSSSAVEPELPSSPVTVLTPPVVGVPPSPVLPLVPSDGSTGPVLVPTAPVESPPLVGSSPPLLAPTVAPPLAGSSPVVLPRLEALRPGLRAQLPVPAVDTRQRLGRAPPQTPAPPQRRQSR